MGNPSNSNPQVTYKGREIIARALGGAIPIPNVLGWGTNPSGLSSQKSDISLFCPALESRVVASTSLATTQTTNDSYGVQATMLSNSSQNISEVGIFDNTTKPTTGLVNSGGVVGSSISTTLNTTTVFSPGNGTFIQIRTEVMQVVSGSGTTSLAVLRGQNTTIPIATIGIGDVISPANPPGNGSVTGGNMFFHGDFTPIALNQNDQINFTITTAFF